MYNPVGQIQAWNWLSRPGTTRVWLVFGLLITSPNTLANPVQTTYSNVQLVAEQATVPAAGGRMSVGFHIEPNPGWHVYWMNPGDAGLPATMQWSLPEGFSASAFEFPAPRVIPFGELVTYGFKEPVLLLSEVAVPSGLPAGEWTTLSGSARWVVCDDELCVPDRASLSLTLPNGDGADHPDLQTRFAAARAKLPQPVDWPTQFEFMEHPVQSPVDMPRLADTQGEWTVGEPPCEATNTTEKPAMDQRTRQAGEAVEGAPDVAVGHDRVARLQVTVTTPTPATEFQDPYLFVAATNVVAYGWQTATPQRDNLVFSTNAGSRAGAVTDFQAVLNYADDAGTYRSVQLHAVRTAKTPPQTQSPTRPPATQTPPPQDTNAVPDNTNALAAKSAVSQTLAPAAGMSLATALLFAFIGGVILNLMPCVFPVLSIKALGLVSTAHADPRHAKQSGLLYTAGILVAFALIGMALVGLREAGQAVGWGFQLQSPLVNLGLALLMLAIGLNLLGVFEIGAGAVGVGQSLTLGDERKAAFFTGLLAVVVATPCTAPFMAGALGYALMRPTPVALGIFLALGLGLAFPYLLVSFVPSFGRALPTPGAWMARFRNILAFPMFATALWLLWVLGKQLGVDSMALGLLATLWLALALWAYGRARESRRTWAWGCLAAAALTATLASGAAVEQYKAKPAASTGGTLGTLGQLELERFTPARLADYVTAGEPTFAYFTADWCVNCKLNERVALASDAVGQAFQERGIKVLVGDWTNEDPIITDWLNRYDRAGVPLYLYFPANATLDDALVLPQVLLPDIVIDAINR